MIKSLRSYIRHVILESIFNDSYFRVGDNVLFGKWKNKKGKIIDIRIDDRGIPIVVIEPTPKGRKKPVTIGLYRIWKSPEELR